jgi:putative ABC transport system permease protein
MDRPTASTDGGRPARRAVLHWSWRMFRRQWRRQFLIIALVAVAVAATIVGAAIATNTPPPAAAGFGSADHLVTLSADPQLGADLGVIRNRIGAIDVIENRRLTTGLAQHTQLRSQDPDGAFGRPMLTLLSGRFPRGAGEVAMTTALAGTLGVQLGGWWTGGGGGARRLVGFVENPQNLLDEFALLPPGQLDAPTRVTVLFDADDAALAGFTFPQHAEPATPQTPDGLNPAVVVFAVAILGLIFVGLVAMAGFSVLAQRRLRWVGLLSSLGATDRNIQLALVGNGAIVGGAGALLGAALGFAAWLAYVPRLESAADHRVAWSDLPWWLVAAVIVLAVATAVAASWRPGRTAARTPVVAALSGRPTPPTSTGRSAVPGAGMLAAGLLLLAFSGGWNGNGGKDVLFQLGGLAACATGLLLLAPAGVAVLGVHADRAPVAVRIALRDLARYRARSGAALAATSFAVLIAMLITVIAAGRFADPVDYFGPNLADDQLMLYTAGNSPGGGPDTPSAGPQDTAAGQLAQAQAVAADLGARNILQLDAAQGATLVQQSGNGDLRGGPGTLYLATPSLLAYYGIRPGDVDPSAFLLTSRPGLQGTARLELLYGNIGSGQHPDGPPPELEALHDPRIQTIAALPTDTATPNLLLTPHAVAELHLHITPSAAWLVQAAAPLTASQINNSRQIAAAAHMTIETKSDAPSLTALGTDATIAGILLALGILALTVGLIRSETAGDLRTLTAVGANRSTRRAITAATAAALGLAGAILGTSVAYLAATAFFRSQLTERMSNPPVLDLALVLVGLPAAAAIGGWLFAGREPGAIARQPID